MSDVNDVVTHDVNEVSTIDSLEQAIAAWAKTNPGLMKTRHYILAAVCTEPDHEGEFMISFSGAPASLVELGCTIIEQLDAKLGFEPPTMHVPGDETYRHVPESTQPAILGPAILGAAPRKLVVVGADGFPLTAPEVKH